MTNQKLSNLALSENGFLFDAVSGDTFTLNQTAKDILKCIIQGVSIDQIVINLSSTYDVSQETAIRDVQQFIHHLTKIQVIPER